MKNFASITQYFLFITVITTILMSCEAQQEPPIRDNSVKIKRVKVIKESPEILPKEKTDPAQDGGSPAPGENILELTPSDSIHTNGSVLDTVQSIREDRKLDIKYVKKSFNLHRKSPIA